MKNIKKSWKSSRKPFFVIASVLIFFVHDTYSFWCCKRRKKTHQTLPSPQSIYQLTETQKDSVQKILFYASKYGAHEIVDLAIELGASVKTEDPVGYNAVCICTAETINLHTKDPKTLKDEVTSNLEKVDTYLRYHGAHVGRHWANFRQFEPFKSQTMHRPASRPASREISKTESDKLFTEPPL
jgi:hypothetical protein